MSSPVVEADSLNFSERDLQNIVRGFLNLFWNVKLSTLDAAYSVAELSNNDLILALSHSILRTDNNGVFKWATSYNNSGFATVPTIVLPTNDNGFVVSSSTSIGQPNNGFWANIAVIKTDSIGYTSCIGTTNVYSPTPTTLLRFTKPTHQKRPVLH